MIKRVSSQLMSLGFGRGPARYETDPHLQIIRNYIMRNPRPELSEQEEQMLSADRICFSESDRCLQFSIHVLLSETVAQFDQSPLSLREQSRNAVRHVVGGTRFRTRAALLPLPVALREFVVVPASSFTALFLKRE